VGSFGLNLSRSEKGPLAGSCDHVNEPSACTKVEEFLD
jgi:hypothetical protein